MQFLVTPALLLALLCGPYILTRLISRENVSRARTAGVAGIALMFLFTGLGHFVKTEPMAQMLPAWVPARIPLVYATGILEIAAGLAVLIPSLRRPIGWLLIAMLVSFLPANIFAAFQRTGADGHLLGPVYLLLRVPLQIVFIAWVYRFAAARQKIDDL